MKKEEKGQIIELIADELQKYPYLYITDMGGLNAEDTSKLRRLCFRREIKLMVVKNTLLKKAMEQSGMDYSELFPVMKGSTSIMLSNTNNAPAKLIKEFRGNAKIPALKGAYVEESFYIGDNQIDALVNIKSKNELIGDIIGMLQSPIQNVISALGSGGNTIAGVVKTLSERA